MQTKCAMVKKAWRIGSFVIMATFCGSVVLAQGKKQHIPFRIALLPGYRLEVVQGTDTRTGEIRKAGGLTIHFDLGSDLPSPQHDSKPAKTWKRECSWKANAYPDAKTDAADVVCWKDHISQGRRLTLHILFRNSAQFWVIVRNDEEVKEVLKMVLTYDPDVT